MALALRRLSCSFRHPIYGSFAMPRLLTNLKFWILAIALVWIVLIIAIIVKDPGFAHGVK
jgi:hypothetical protein